MIPKDKGYRTKAIHPFHKPKICDKCFKLIKVRNGRRNNTLYLKNNKWLCGKCFRIENDKEKLVMSRYISMSTKISPEEYKKVKETAKKYNISISSFSRNVILDFIEKEEEVNQNEFIRKKETRTYNKK